jgi:hypothetical protein
MTTESPDEYEYEAVPSRRTVLVIGILSVVALVLAGAALILNLVHGSTAATADSCRSLAWAALPDETTLPSGWSLANSGFYSDGYSTSFIGPQPSDTTTPQSSIFVRLNCLGTDDVLAMTRSHDAGVAAGATEVPFAKLGDQSFALQDATGGTTVYFRQSGIVAYLVADSTVTPTELQQAATAVDLAITGAAAESGGIGSAGSTPPPGGVIVLGSPGPSSGPGASVGPAPTPTSTPSHAVPALEAVLPHTISGTPFTTQSLTGTDAIGTDAASVALGASIKGFGKVPGDFQVAEAYDNTGTIQVTVIGFRLTGIDATRLRQAIIASWIVAAGSGVTQANATVGGKAVVKVDYADGGPLDYVYVQGITVYDVSTSDVSLAATVLGQLP